MVNDALYALTFCSVATWYLLIRKGNRLNQILGSFLLILIGVVSVNVQDSVIMFVFFGTHLIIAFMKIVEVLPKIVSGPSTR